MIGKLKGKIEYSAEEHVVIDVGGVGYIVHCSKPTLAALPPVGSDIELYTELLVREDLLQLCGFLSLGEREFFLRLLTVPGVGFKAAQSVIGTLGVTACLRAISLGNWQALRAAPMVGPKLAQRICNELKTKIEDIVRKDGQYGGVGQAEHATAVGAGPAVAAVGTPAEHTQSSIRSDAVSALKNLGYSGSDAARVVAAVALDDVEMTTGEIIREALKHLATAGA